MPSIPVREDMDVDQPLMKLRTEPLPVNAGYPLLYRDIFKEIPEFRSDVLDQNSWVLNGPAYVARPAPYLIEHPSMQFPYKCFIQREICGAFLNPDAAYEDILVLSVI